MSIRLPCSGVNLSTPFFKNVFPSLFCQRTEIYRQSLLRSIHKKCNSLMIINVLIIKTCEYVTGMVIYFSYSM